MTDPLRSLYLAVPVDIFNDFFQERFIQVAILQNSLSIITYDPDLEEVVEWKN